MILIGEGKIHADNLPDETYYYLNKTSIALHLFTETCYGIRFAPVILETIKKTHKILAYILRNQYKNSDKIFTLLLSFDSLACVNEVRYAHALFQRMSQCPELLEYYKDVDQFLIQPSFKRFGYFSPTMSIVIFIGLLCFLGETYANESYGLVWKHFVKDSYPEQNILMACRELGPYTYNMVADEMQTWTQMKSRS